jgi:MFS transporter, AAHS family, 4-hydroxybenzoate transporter
MGVTTGVNRVIDENPLSCLQLRALILCGLVAMLDGNDTLIMGLGAPSLAAALHVAPSAIGWAISGSWLGAALGALFFGSLADRFGRKTMLIVAVALFGFFTIATPFAPNLPVLVAFRVLTGIGLGGATPCFIALASEYAPARIRGTIVSLVWAAFPLGIFLGGLVNGWIFAQYSWDAIFRVGGGLALLVAAVLFLALPESVAFLSKRENGREAARRILEQIAPDSTSASLGLTADVPAPVGSARGAVIALFTEGRRQPTLSLWVMLFTCFGTTASLSWVPTILRQHDITLSAASIAMSFHGVGALLGMAVAGRLVDRFGAVRGLVAPMILGAVSTAATGYCVASAVATSIFVALLGLLVGIGASGGIALIARVYPTDIRSTGAGWALGLGRFGQVVMPGIFALMLGASWNVEMIFLALGVLPLIGAGAALLVEPRALRQPLEREGAMRAH